MFKKSLFLIICVSSIVALIFLLSKSNIITSKNFKNSVPIEDKISLQELPSSKIENFNDKKLWVNPYQLGEHLIYNDEIKSYKLFPPYSLMNVNDHVNSSIVSKINIDALNKLSFNNTVKTITISEIVLSNSKIPIQQVQFLIKEKNPNENNYLSIIIFQGVSNNLDVFFNELRNTKKDSLGNRVEVKDYSNDKSEFKIFQTTNQSHLYEYLTYENNKFIKTLDNTPVTKFVYMPNELFYIGYSAKDKNIEKTILQTIDNFIK